MSDFHFNLLSAKLIKLITERIKKNKIKVSTAEVFAVLTTPLKRSLLLEQDLNMLKLLKEIQKNKDLENSFRQNKNLRAKLEKSSLWPKIKAHTKKYDWLQYHYLGPTILSVNYFIELLQGLVKQKVKAEENLKDLMNKEKETEEKQEELKDKLKFTSSELYWIEMAKEFIYLKGYRKDLTFMACRSYEDLLKEMAKRFDISLKQLQFMTLEEILDGLRNNNYPNPDLLNERFKYCVIYYPQGKAKVYVGKKARKMAEKIKEEKISEKLREFKGTPAFPGKATGKVIKVFNSKDMSKMKEKRILVSPATNPNIMPAITKAAAIITDEGGITCHAAIVSRELKIPCVIGTKIATQVLKDGDKVEVDAEQGIVKIL
ncbi:hypothetical protein KKF32_02095 [Patescibacteria group bacterium]|nr:hypothetical protein [Patescibacteria group bacterium]